MKFTSCAHGNSAPDPNCVYCSPQAKHKHAKNDPWADSCTICYPEHTDCRCYICTTARNLALEEAARVADDLFQGFARPHEYSENVADAIRALKTKTGEEK